MKKSILLFCLIVSTFASSQEKSNFPKNEIKANALFLVLGAVEVSYEHLLKQDAGVGVTLFFVSDKSFDTEYNITPYYRVYFGKKPAAGFFVEGFSMISGGKYGGYSTYDYNTNSYYNVAGKNYTDFALGFGVGSKWVHKSGFLFEINAGIGRNLLNSNGPKLVGRAGVTLGYRF